MTFYFQLPSPRSSRLKTADNSKTAQPTGYSNSFFNARQGIDPARYIGYFVSFVVVPSLLLNFFPNKLQFYTYTTLSRNAKTHKTKKYTSHFEKKNDGLQLLILRKPKKLAVCQQCFSISPSASFYVKFSLPAFLL